MAYSTNTISGSTVKTWEPETDTVDSEVTRITSQDSPLMKQAATQGASSAAKRGLLNSSMGTQAAQQAVYGVALPMAQQNAQQTAAKNLSTQESGQQLGLLHAGYDRKETLDKSLQNSQLAAVNLNSVLGNYASMWSNVASNQYIPSDTRDRYNDHLANFRDTASEMINSLYGTSLEWD